MRSHRNLNVFGLLLALSAAAFAQPSSAVCDITAVPNALRAEGLSEEVGDIVFTCTAQANSLIQGNLNVSLNTYITNRLRAGNVTDALLTVDTGAGPALMNVPGTLFRANEVVFAGLNVRVPGTGRVEFRVSGLRADASGSGGTFQNVFARLSWEAGSVLTFTRSSFAVGVPGEGLLATTAGGFISSQIGSPLPDDFSFGGFLAAGTAVSTMRVTEGFASAFEPRRGTADHGTRIVIRYANRPDGARMFLPNAIAGLNAAVPTSVGHFAAAPSPGSHQPGSNTLLLVRVLGTDPGGAGGYLVGAGFGEMSEVPLANGAGIAVFEVVEANPSQVESALIPAFMSLPRTVEARSLSTTASISFGPISTVAQASANAPVPRFVARSPVTDCTFRGDCNQYVPKLRAQGPSMEFTLVSGSGFATRYFTVENAGGGTMTYSARVEYRQGSGWVKVDPPINTGSGTVRVDVLAANLAPGTYEATLVIDGGPQAGSARFPIRVQVTAPAPPPPPANPVPSISSVSNAASFAAGGLVRGSLATIRGTNFAGANLSVTLDGMPVRVLFSNAEQINILVPPELGDRPSAQLIVTAAGQASASQNVQLAPVNPGIFPTGILNQDNTVNSATNPVRAGSYIQIYATGLLPPEANGTVEVKIHDVWMQAPAYAGPAPGIAGVQQINLFIPGDWTTITTDLLVCSTVRGVRACSPPVRISIRE